MQSTLLKKVFLWSSGIVVTAASGILIGCTNPSQPQATNPTVPQTEAAHGMHHGGGASHASMNLGPADAEFDLRFIDAMIPHHEGAVDMARDAEKKSKRPEIKKLAADIIKAQEKEIAQLKRWRQQWYAKAGNAPVAYNPTMGHSMPMSAEQVKQMKMDQDLGAADADFDLRFINAMIPHHEGAVDMAQDAQNKTQRPEIKQLTQEILTSQQAEIKQMQEWRKAWYNQ